MPSKRNIVKSIFSRNEQALNALMDRASEQFEKLAAGTPLSHNYQAQDAFRHVYASAILTRDLTQVSNEQVAERMAEFMGWSLEAMAAIQRENNNSQINSREIGMDLHNNEVGRAIARELGPNASDDAIASRAMQAVRTGEAIGHPKDPRTLERFESEMTLKGMSAVREAISKGIESAKDLLENSIENMDDLGKSLWNGTQEKMRSLMEDFKDLPVFKISDAQVENANTAEMPGEILNALESQVAVVERWQSTPEEYEKDSGILAQASGEMQRIAQAEEIQAESAAELEASMDA